MISSGRHLIAWRLALSFSGLPASECLRERVWEPLRHSRLLLSLDRGYFAEHPLPCLAFRLAATDLVLGGVDGSPDRGATLMDCAAERQRSPGKPGTPNLLG